MIEHPRGLTFEALGLALAMVFLSKYVAAEMERVAAGREVNPRMDGFVKTTRFSRDNNDGCSAIPLYAFHRSVGLGDR